MLGDSISVQCKCGKKLKAPATAIGKKAKCPGCGDAVLISERGTSMTAPAPRPTTARPAPPSVPRPGAPVAKPAPPHARAAAPVKKAPPPPPPPPAEDSLDALYDLAEDANQAHTRGAVRDSTRCPQCQNALAPDAVICVNCGYNVKLGKAVETKVVTKPKPLPPAAGGSAFGAKQAPADAMAPTGSLLVGIGMSLAFALGAGLVKFLISWGLGWDIFFLTLLIGGAAGLGMQMGYKGYSKLGGVMAALVTLVVIIVTRVAVIMAVVLPAWNGGEGEGADYDERVIHQLTEETLKSRGLDPDTSTDEQDESAEKAAIAKLKAMPQPEYQQLIAKADVDEEKEDLADQLADEALDTARPSSIAEVQKQRANARAKVDAMSADQRKAEIKRLEAKAAAEEAAEAEAAKNRPKSEKDGGGSGAAVVVGFVVVILLVFGLWALLSTIIAMGLAYKTAAGSVSG